jgi:hypothetical protein
MKVNWAKFFFVFCIMQVALMLAGCSAAWLGAVSALLPALEAAISAAVAFVVALEGKTVPASVSASIQALGNDIAAQIANVQTLIADYKAAATTGLLSQIQAVFQGILTNLDSILSGFNVTDLSTVSKLTQLVGLAVAAVQAILGLIPLVQAKLASGAPKAELEADDQFAANQVKGFEKGLKEGYVEIVTTPTANADVNVALASLPQSF